MAASVSLLGVGRIQRIKGQRVQHHQALGLLAYSCFFLVSSNRAATTPSPLEITVPMPTTTRQHTRRPASWRNPAALHAVILSSFVIIAILHFLRNKLTGTGRVHRAFRTADEISLKKCPRAAVKTANVRKGPADRLKTVYHNRPQRQGGPPPARSTGKKTEKQCFCNEFFCRTTSEKIRRKSKENYGVSVNSLWRGARCRPAPRSKARPSRVAGAGTGNTVKKQSGAESSNGGLHAGQKSPHLPSMAWPESVPPPGVR